MIDGITVSYPDGAVVFRQGDPAAEMYVVRSGSVRITRTGDDGGTCELGLIGPGDFFGEMALFVPGTRSATAVAVGETELDCVDKPTFMALVKDPVVWRILAKMSERVRATDERLADALDD